MTLQAFLVALGSNGVTETQATVLQDIYTSDTQAPTLTGASLNITSLDVNTGTFTLAFDVTTDEPATIQYSIYRYAPGIVSGRVLNAVSRRRIKSTAVDQQIGQPSHCTAPREICGDLQLCLAC